jgi:Domain of unknown function (DUF5664)
MDGRKDDQEKPRWDLLPLVLVEPTVRVLTFGASKYAPENWRKVPDGHNRYFAAAMRYLASYQSGEKAGPETGESHLAHAICCLIFLTGLGE